MGFSKALSVLNNPTKKQSQKRLLGCRLLHALFMLELAPSNGQKNYYWVSKLDGVEKKEINSNPTKSESS